RPIAASAAASIRRSPGPSSKRWSKALRLRRNGCGGDRVMQRSTDHILTSHVGSLPRPDALIAANTSSDTEALEATLSAAVIDVVRQQREVGIDVAGDGEFGKPTGHRVNYGAWWHYSFQRLGGLDLDGPAETEPRQSRAGEIVLTNASHRRDRAR